MWRKKQQEKRKRNEADDTAVLEGRILPAVRTTRTLMESVCISFQRIVQFGENGSSSSKDIVQISRRTVLRERSLLTLGRLLTCIDS